MANTPKNILMAVVCTMLAITMGQHAYGSSNNIHGMFLAESSMSTPGEPPAPTITVGCGSSVATRATPPSGVTYYWQGTNSNGFSLGKFANKDTVTSPGTYYIRARNNTTYSWSASRAFYVNVKPRPQPPEGTDAMRMGNGSLNLSVTQPTSGSTARWYHEGSLVSSGENNFTTPHLTTTRTYTVKSMKDGCESLGSRSLNAIITTAPTVTVRCGSSLLTRTSNPPSGVEYYWQSVSGGTNASTVNSLDTFNVLNAGWYYLRARRPDGVWSTGQASVYANVNSFPEPPQGNDVMREDPGTVSLSVTHNPTGASANWYFGGTLKAAGENNYTTPQLTGTRTYTVRAVKDGCESSESISLKAIVTTAFDAGRATSAGGYTSTQNIALHTKDYFGTTALAGNDIFYRIELPVAGNISAHISSTPSHHHYKLHLLNSSFQHIITHDIAQNGTPLTSNNHSAGVYYIVTDASTTTGSVTTNITVTLPHSNAVPTSTQNYILTTTMMVPGEPSRLGDIQQSVTYYDGLGRPMQSIGVKASPTGSDIVQPIYYDALGRQSHQVLPYSTVIEEPNNNGAYRADAWKPDLAASEARTFYHTNSQSLMPYENYPFAQTVYDNSPLNRVMEQGAPGAHWQPATSGASGSGKTIRYAYGSNASSDGVRRWQVNSNHYLSSQDLYADNTLYKLETHDEDNNLRVEFKDLQGRVVASDAYSNASTRHRTQYVYDDFGRLRYVLSPEFSNLFSGGGSFSKTDTDIRKWCYYYEYDARGRMIEKQLPGADKVEMVYDIRDRLVATRDGVQFDKSKWTIIRYDNLNRVAYTGILDKSASRDELQLSIDGNNWLGTVTRTINPQANSLGYSTLAIPGEAGPTTYLHATYYDDYNFPKNDLPDSLENVESGTYNNTKSPHTRGLVTGERVLVLETTTYLHSLYLYDDKGRVVQSKQQRFYGTPNSGWYDVNTHVYHFNGQVARSRIRQYSPLDNGTGITYREIYQRYEYDHAWRPTRTYHQIESGTEILVSNLNYNELGQLKEKKLHKENMASYQQVTDYRYNIRGWLTRINDPYNLKAYDLFGMQLNYNTPFTPLGAIACHNGNISRVLWRHNDNNFNQAYGYKYDGLNRLLKADYGQSNDSNWVNAAYDVAGNDNGYISYDLNGNIKSLIRNNSSGFSTNYSFDYIGNQLNTVNSGSIFTYDQNGNMTKHKLHYYEVKYNELNLPKEVSKTNLGGDGLDKIGYIYSSKGEKLGKMELENTYTFYAYPFVYNISSDGFKLKYILFDEGTIAYETGGQGTYTYQYNLKDHLGNTRAVFKPTASGPDRLQKTDYYPFGMAHQPLQNPHKNQYLYNGKEIQDDVLGGTAFNWYDYGARFYDPQIARWHSVDPLAEKYLQWSPYNYTLGNPIRYIDPDGRQVTGPYGMGLETASYDYYANAEWAKDIPRETSNMQTDINIGKQDAKAINQMLDGGAELNDVLDALGHGTVVLGIPLGVIEHFGGLEEFNNLLKSGKFETVWNGQTRKWSLNFKGNPSVSGSFVKEAKSIYVANAANAAKDSRLLNLVKGGGTALAITGGFVSGAQFALGNIGAAEFTADMVFTAIAIKGGPGGWAVSSFYFVGKTALDHPHDMRSNVGGFDFSNQSIRRSPHQVPRR